MALVALNPLLKTLQNLAPSSAAKFASNTSRLGFPDLKYFYALFLHYIKMCEIETLHNNVLSVRLASAACKLRRVRLVEQPFKDPH